jgi:lysophospholipase L1-like esterase
MQNTKENSNKEALHVSIVGNSVSLRLRPPVEHPENKNFTYLLRDEGFLAEKRSSPYFITNLSSGGATVRSVFNRLDNIIRTYPDVYIINLGVVDSSTREVPRWFFNIYNSSSQYWYNNLARVFYVTLIKRLRKPLVYLRGKSTWVGKRSFEKLYGMLIERLSKETNAVIIGVSINIANDRVEKELPCSRRNHIFYNEIIKSCLDRQNCLYLDLTDLDSETHYPDGVHFSKIGHEVVADRLIETLEKL